MSSESSSGGGCPKGVAERCVGPKLESAGADIASGILIVGGAFLRVFEREGASGTAGIVFGGGAYCATAALDQRLVVIKDNVTHVEGKACSLRGNVLTETSFSSYQRNLSLVMEE